MLIALAITLAALVALFAFVASRPSTFRIERSARIDAAPAAIAPLIEDFRRWQTWSPWEKLDPSLQRTFSGAPSGVGAVYEWRGGAKAGAGRMEIIDATARRIAIKLEFIKPFSARNAAEFTFTPADGAAGRATELRWAMFGPRPFVSKLMALLVDIDRMVGKDFEAGLAAIKQQAERPGA